LQDGTIGREELFDAGCLADLRKCGRGGDAELVKMAMLLLLGLLKTRLNLSLEKAESMRLISFSWMSNTVTSLGIFAMISMMIVLAWLA
jgi:hypothetical protein